MIQDESREVPVNDYTRGRFSDVDVVSLPDINLIRIGYVHPSHWVLLRSLGFANISRATAEIRGGAITLCPGVGKKDVV